MTKKDKKSIILKEKENFKIAIWKKKIPPSQHFPKIKVGAQDFILLVSCTLRQLLISLSAISRRDCSPADFLLSS